MKIYQVIYESSGFIVCTMEDPITDPGDDYSPNHSLIFLAEGEIHPDTHFVDVDDSNAVKPLANFPTITQSVVDLSPNWDITLTGIPVDTVVNWPDDVVTNETDGQVELEVTTADDYIFRLCHPRYFELEVIVNVTP
jgi:hypothetical protein